VLKIRLELCILVTNDRTLIRDLGWAYHHFDTHSVDFHLCHHVAT